MTEAVFVKHLEKIFVNQGYFVKKEIGTGYGIADLVMVKFNKHKFQVRKTNKQTHPLLKESYFTVLKYLPDIANCPKPLSYLALVKKTRLSSSFLKYNLLRNLEKFGYIKEVDGNKFFKVNGWVPLAKEVVAIEAKLHDWRRGFIQANRYKSFADKVYLAMPEQYIHRVNKELLISQNIGLIKLSNNLQNIKEEIKPRINKLFISDKRNFVVENYIKKALAN